MPGSWMWLSVLHCSSKVDHPLYLPLSSALCANCIKHMSYLASWPPILYVAMLKNSSLIIWLYSTIFKRCNTFSYIMCDGFTSQRNCAIATFEVFPCGQQGAYWFNYRTSYNSGRAWASPEYKNNIWRIRCTCVCMYLCMYVSCSDTSSTCS